MDYQNINAMTQAQTAGVTQPKQRELEALCSRLGRSLTEMRENNDNLQVAVAHLCNEPQPAPPPGAPAAVGPAEPSPGTLSLHMLSDKIANEVERQGHLRAKLGGIF